MSLSHRVELGRLCRSPTLDRHQDGSPTVDSCVPFDGCRVCFSPASSRRKPGIRLPSATRRFAGCLQIDCLGYELESLNARGLCGPTSVLRGSGHGRVLPWLRSVAQAKRNCHDVRTPPFPHWRYLWANSNQPAGRPRDFRLPASRIRAKQPADDDSESKSAWLQDYDVIYRPAHGFGGLRTNCNRSFRSRTAACAASRGARRCMLEQSCFASDR
jgi:hypothetical protein